MALAQLSAVTLEYVPHGDGPLRVVFIHGFQASARIWQAVQHALPADQYTSLAINNRGAGASGAPPAESDFTIPIFAEDAFELIEQLGWSEFTLVGHSLGGAVAAQFAVDHGERLNGLILLDPADPDGRDIPGGDVMVDAVIDRAMAARQDQLAKGDAADGIDARAGGVDPDLMRQLAKDMRAAPERRLRGSFRSMLNIRIGSRLKSLGMPVLLAGGDADELIPVSGMLATWAKCPPGTGLHFWHGVGHSPNLDCPLALAALIRKFVEETIPNRAA